MVDPFHVVRLAGDAIDRCRMCIQQDTLGHRGSAGDPLLKARRALHTGAGLLTESDGTRPFRLNVLQASAARRLYERHGFVLESEDAVDVFMKAEPA